MKFYYIAYLKKYDSKVSDNKHSQRPYVGIVLQINRINYYTPFSSPTPIIAYILFTSLFCSHPCCHKHNDSRNTCKNGNKLGCRQDPHTSAFNVPSEKFNRKPADTVKRQIHCHHLSICFFESGSKNHKYDKMQKIKRT